MPQAKLVKILVGVIVAFAAGAALLYSVRQEVKVDLDLARTRDTAPQLAEVHRKAVNGTVKMLGPDSLEMALISAGFPPKRPMPSLKPRADLKGGAVADAADQTVAFATYVAREGRFTIFTLPTGKEILPADAAPIIRRGKPMHLVKQGDLVIAFWKSGFWYTAVAIEMTEGDRDLFIDFIRQAQGT